MNGRGIDVAKPLLLDLFCGAGGAAMGYSRVGFDVVGVDNNPQPNYPFEFILADAMTFPLDGFDVIHASPPCQRYTRCTPPQHRDKHPDLLGLVSLSLRAAGVPYAIENVPDARAILRDPVMLCGTMFRLPTLRHRYFEIWPNEDLILLPACAHPRLPVVVTGTTRRKTGRLEYRVQDCRDAMEIQWMTRTELDEAIPPAYTEYIGKQLIDSLH